MDVKNGPFRWLTPAMLSPDFIVFVPDLPETRLVVAVKRRTVDLRRRLE